jgi:hypothetical protein
MASEDLVARYFIETLEDGTALQQVHPTALFGNVSWGEQQEIWQRLDRLRQWHYRQFRREAV